MRTVCGLPENRLCGVPDTCCRDNYFRFLVEPTFIVSTTVTEGCVSAYLFVVKRPVIALLATLVDFAIVYYGICCYTLLPVPM